mmetsp:Transcript_20182/g.34036  ORF Transcript_20182/g.34036 Transcript_20182/m.34036 type:complete len:875 (+) Transcript_20182:68-2692(+)
MGTSQSKKVKPAVAGKTIIAGKKAQRDVFVEYPNAEMIDLRGTVGSQPRFQIGVTEHFFPWFSELIQSDGGVEFPTEISTEQLVWGRKCQGPTGPSPIEWNIANQTKYSKCSFIVWCLAKGYSEDKNGRPLFAPVTTFVSHAWKGSFVSLKNSITEHCKLQTTSNDSGSSEAPPAFFLDIFVVNQHTPPWKETPVVGMDYALKQPIELSLKTLLVMSPFEDPVPLKRAWCIYEICNTKRLGATLNITMPEEEHKRFIDALTLGEFDFNDWITNIDIEKAGAFDPNDKQMIMNLVSQSPGAAAGLNRTVVMALCEWLSTQGYLALERIPEKERGSSKLIKNLANVIWRQGKPDEAETLYEEMVKCRREAFGDNDERTLDGLHIWGRFQRAKGQWDMAQKVLEETVAGRKALFGTGHEDTLTSQMELAEVYRGMDQLDKADELIREIVKGWRVVMASLDARSIEDTTKRTKQQIHFIHVNFLESLKVSAAVMMQKGQASRSDVEIKNVLDELLKGRVQLFGERNPATLDVVVLEAQHKLAMNEPVTDAQVEAMTNTSHVLRSTLGNTHPRTLNCICILSQMLKVQMSKDSEKMRSVGLGGTDPSMELIKEGVNGYTETLGRDHPDTKRATKLRDCRASDIEKLIDRFDSCFSPESKLLMADGVTTKLAKDIQIGDKLYAPTCGTIALNNDNTEATCTVVRGHVIQKEDEHFRHLVQIGEMLISKMHRIQHKGVWIRPTDYPGAVEVKQPCELHNFIVDGLTPIVVNDIVASTIGTFCEGGLHDLKQPNHALWATKHIANVFEHHPLWPVVKLDAQHDNFLKVIKNLKFAEEFLKRPKNKGELRELLVAHGWQRSSSSKQQETSLTESEEMIASINE